MKERDEELALFLEMRRREKENEKNDLLLLQNSEELDLSNLGMFFFLSCFCCYYVLVNDVMVCYVFFLLQNPIMKTLWFPRWYLQFHQRRLWLKSSWIQRMISLIMNGNFGLIATFNCWWVCVIWLFEYIDLVNQLDSKDYSN